MASTALAVSIILLSQFANAVHYKGKDYDDGLLRKGLEYYQTFMNDKFGGFTLLPQAKESQWEAEAFGANGKEEFETALKETWINPVTRKHFYTADDALNYAVVSVGSTSTQSVAVVNGKVTAMAIEGAGTFGAMQGLSEKQVGDFLGHLEKALTNAYGAVTGDVYVFFINSIEFAVAEGKKLIYLNVKVPDTSLTLTAKNNKAAVTAQRMAKKWATVFKEAPRFKAFIKAKILPPKVSNAWRDIAVKNSKAEIIGVCDIGGGLSINVVTLTETKTVVKGNYKAKGKPTINELFIDAILDTAAGAGTEELKIKLLKRRVPEYGREVLKRIEEANFALQKVLKLKKPLSLKQIHAYQTGLTRWFWEQLQKTTTTAKQAADDYYYEEYEYEEEYNEQVEIYKAGYMKGYEDAFARLQRMQGAQTRPMVHKRHKDYV